MRKPKTAYGLLGLVCREIESNPLNYYQGMWKTSRNGGKDVPLPHDLDVDENECKTAYCRAGFIVNAMDGYSPRRTTWGFDWARRARKILGMDADQVYQLFAGDAIIGKPGTKRYVKAGVSGLKKFMYEHRERLLARKLSDVPKR